MATPNSDMGELISATLRHRRKPIADAVTNNNALYTRLRKKKHMELVGGGTEITSPIDYIENPNFQFYSGYDRLAISPQEVIDSVKVDWKQWAVGVTISGAEILKNMGEEQVFKILGARIKNAERTLANQLSEAVYSDGTGSGGLQVTGLQAWIADAAGGTVGSINSGTYTWWDNQRNTSTSLDRVNAYREMLALYLSCSRGNDQPDLIVADNTFFQAYSESLQQQARYMDREMAEAGFRNNLMFQNAPVIYDGGIGGDAPAGMYFINCEYLKFCIHRNRNNVVLEGPKRSLNQDAETRIVAGMGNVICTNRKLMGRMT
jgi:hypothetical protein